LVNKRIEGLSLSLTNLEIQNKANSFVHEQLIPAWENLKKRITEGLSSVEINSPMDRTSWILSPSDFGFHNTLEHGEELYFFDFEYAGWDDPAKLICDFVCQPEIPVNRTHAELFVNELINDFPEGESFIRRVRLLLPGHRLKWCCILLNEFLPVNLQRRLHAGRNDKNLLSEQLEKAKDYFNRHNIN